MGFLGGISFSALVLVISSPKFFIPTSRLGPRVADEYFRVTITDFAVTSALFVFASIGMMQIAGGKVKAGTLFEFICSALAATGIVFFMGGLILLLAPLTNTGTGIVIVTMLTSFAAIVFGLRWEGRKITKAQKQASLAQKQETKSTEPTETGQAK